MNGLTYAQLQKYSIAVSVFKRIEAYNISVAARHSVGDLSQSYYSFQNTGEQAQYRLGLFLLVQNDIAYANYTVNYRI